MICIKAHKKIPLLMKRDFFQGSKLCKRLVFGHFSSVTDFPFL